MKTFSLLLAFLAVSIFAIGCADDKPKTPTDATDNQTEDDGHAHDHTPPHGGHLIELGRNHEYHAELVDNHETESITIYILDGNLKPLSLDQSSISLILTSGDKTETFELAASKPDGSSEYTSNDEKMMAMIEAESVTGKLRVTIDGKPFSGSFDHLGHKH